MRSFLIVLFFLASMVLQAQELRCRVNIVSSQIQRSDREIFRTLQREITEFMNNRIWTPQVYGNYERIECAIFINLEKELSQNEWEGSMQVQVSRPVYNSSYSSVLLNLRDKDIQFSYVENQSMEFSLSSHMSNLTSLLAYYAYVIIAFDADSFKEEGGTAFFQKAETVVRNAQGGAKEPGWQPHESSERRNRYWLVNNLLSSNYRNIRSFYYTYHRQGLDRMSDKLNDARSEMVTSLSLLQEVNRRRPDPYMYPLRLVLDAKSDEFIQVFSEGPMDERSRVHRILTEMDASNADKYKVIKESN